MKKFKYPFLAGALTGGMLTTVVYVAISSFLSLSWSAQHQQHRSREVQEVSEHIVPEVAELGVDLVPEVVLNTPENFDFEVGNDSEELFNSNPVAEQQLWRKMLLTVVAGGGSDLYERVHTTWGNGSKDWKLVVGSEQNTHTSPETILKSTCGNLPSSGSYMLSRELVCVLETVFKRFHAQYRWFLFVPESVYVSVSHLHQLLSHLDPDNGISYLGLPHNIHGHCIGDSGFILSQHTFSAVIPLLGSCLESEGSEVAEGDVFLGNCIKEKLQATCLKLGQVSHVMSPL